MKKRFSLTLAAALLGLMTTTLVAQEEGQAEAIVVSAIETSDSGPDGAPTQQLRVFSTNNVMPQTFVMDTMAGGGAMSFNFGGAVDKFSMLQNPSIQKEIELVDEQVQQIREIQREFGQKIKEQLKGGISGEKAKNLGELIRKLKEEQKEKMNDVLLEHQQERLNQVSLQTQLRNSGTANALATANFKEALGLSDEQIEKLRKKATELKKDMEEKIKKMREEMKEELLGELSSSQRRKLTKMLGDKYEPKSEDWKFNLNDRIRRARERRNDGD